MEEYWKDIKGYEGYYQVSNQGRIKSLIGWNGHKRIKREKLINGWIQTMGESGYKRRMIALCKEGSRKDLKVHRLVALTFLDNPKNYGVINHKDGNPLNNSVENLEWCTQKHNNNHAIKTGLRHVVAYEKKQEVLGMYKNGKSIKAICEKLNANERTVKHVLNKNGITIRNTAYYHNKYDINRQKLIKEFESGKKNVDIAKIFNTNRSLIGVYKHLWRKGELIK